MPTRPSPPTRASVVDDDAVLDLPPLDDTGDDATADAEDLDDDLLPADDGGDALDDATLGGAAEDLLETAGVESGWLLDAEDAAGLDIGGVDLDTGNEEKILVDDEAEDTAEEDPELEAANAGTGVDGGEEGPLDEDEELREEDLPMLDADDEGDVDDRELFEAGVLGGDTELLWADRAWVRVALPAPAGDVADEEGEDSSPVLPVPGLDPAHAARDARWRALDEGGRVTAVAMVPGGSVIVAVASPDGTRARLVRIAEDGEARIIAEVEPQSAGEEEDGCEIASLHWVASEGVLVAAGTFGRHAFRPA